MTKHLVAFRVDDDEFDALKLEAERRQMKPGQLARLKMREHQSRENPAYAALRGEIKSLSDKVHSLTESVEVIEVLSGATVAAASIPPGFADPIPETMKDQVRGHMKESLKQGKLFARAFRDGKISE